MQIARLVIIELLNYLFITKSRGAGLYPAIHSLQSKLSINSKAWRGDRPQKFPLKWFRLDW
jgi:hypothetical protein